MIAVADASPLWRLVLIGEIDFLPQLFSRVLVPQTVVLELLHEDAPAVVRAWASSPPAWISVVQTPNAIFLGMEKLQDGERYWHVGAYSGSAVPGDIGSVRHRPGPLIRPASAIVAAGGNN